MIEVILRQDVKSLGQAGDMVRVKPGYARNYLLPKGFAYPATEGNKKRIAGETRALGVRLAAEREMPSGWRRRSRTLWLPFQERLARVSDSSDPSRLRMWRMRWRPMVSRSTSERSIWTIPSRP